MSFPCYKEGMKINGNEIRPGHTLEHKGGLWSVVRVNHVKPGKGGAFAQVEMKNLNDGTKLNERFRSSETVERAQLEQNASQFLYREGDMLAFMDSATYEQVQLPRTLAGEQEIFLQEGMMVSLESHQGKILSISLPPQVSLAVREADAVVKGQTASASYKPAILENGAKVMVPPFIASGEKIIIDTATLEYIRRAE